MSDRPVDRGDLVEWIAYLKDIGVEDMGTPPRAPRPVPAARPPGSAGTGRPERTATPGEDLPLLATPGPDADPDADDPTPRLARAGSLDDIREVLGDCRRCRLHERRTQIVFGVGNPEARLMFVGEGPGADEDLQGEPFVGRAGRKLNEMIEKGVGLARADVYIANVVKCRPPDNRTPVPDEVGACSPFLFAQIEAIRPEVVVTLGAPATRLVLDTREGITRIRGQWRKVRGIDVLPTFHPAYLLRAYTVENRRKVYEDMLAVRARLGLGS